MTIASRFPIRNLQIEVLEGVVIKEVNWPMIMVVEAMFLVCWKRGVIPKMTGAAQNEAYPVGGIHDQGLAWDFRSSAFSDPKSVLLELTAILRGIDKGFHVAHHDVGFGFHFHIEYRGG